MQTASCARKLLLASLAFAPAFILAQEKPMTGQALRDSWVDKEIVGTIGSGAAVSMRLEQDGKASVTVGNTSDTGSWRTHDNGYCATWTKIRRGEERCFTVIKSDAGYKVLNPDGSTSANITAVK